MDGPEDPPIAQSHPGPVLILAQRQHLGGGLPVWLVWVVRSVFLIAIGKWR